MWELWTDLEIWANEDLKGELGLFYFDIAGKWVHVGLPVGQTLLSESEIDALPDVFARSGVDPASPLADNALAQTVLKHAQNDLRVRTKRVLESKPSGGTQDLRQTLIDAIRDELNEWDGRAEAADSAVSSRRAFGSLRLCCRSDRLAEEAKFTLRCKTAASIPEEGLLLLTPSISEERFECGNYLLGWSEEICEASTGQALNASTLDWVHGSSFTSVDNAWALSLTPSAVRIFVDGRDEQLPGLVEVHQLVRNTRMAIAVSKKAVDQIDTWGTASCSDWERLTVASGLPSGWTLFACRAVNDDTLVRSKFLVLQFVQTQRVFLDGGIRTGRGNTFFSFAPPRIRIEGWDPSVEIRCNDNKLSGASAPGVFTLPQSLRKQFRVDIEVSQGGEKVRRKVVYLEQDFSWQDESLPDVRDIVSQAEEADTSEAFQLNREASKYWPVPPIGKCDEIVLLGSVSGQVSLAIRGPSKLASDLGANDSW